ncbi:MAG TPA: sigma-70 family RNA polymerase sigma factor [Gemmatimonadaceae bacterium]|nr:sigma-70 family RNA polymerase sigma factor [Gemmatimonadaceae bacterium]
MPPPPATIHTQAPVLVGAQAATGGAANVDDADRELLNRISREDVSALDEVLARYWAPLIRYVSVVLDSRDAAEDVAQETFYRLWEQRSKVRIDGSLRGFLYQVARNLAISERRRDRASERTAIALFDEQPAFASVELADHHLRAVLQRAVNELPERRREILLLHTVHGLTYKEIGRLLGIAPQTVANQFSAALSTLRGALPFLRSMV